MQRIHDLKPQGESIYICVISALQKNCVKINIPFSILNEWRYPRQSNVHKCNALKPTLLLMFSFVRSYLSDDLVIVFLNNIKEIRGHIPDNLMIIFWD